MATRVRERHRVKSQIAQNPKDTNLLRTKHVYKAYNLLRENAWFTIFVYFAFLLLLVRERSSVLPDANTLPATKDTFSESRARQDLVAISSKWPRQVGCEFNEVYALEYILNAIEAIRHNNLGKYKIELDVQNVSGNLTLLFLGGMTSIYKNVKNIVVKMTPITDEKEIKDYLLVNSHYDAAIGSPG